MDKEYTVYELNDNDYPPFGPENITYPAVIVDSVLYNCLNDDDLVPFIARWVLQDNVKTDADTSAARNILAPITEKTHGKIEGAIDHRYMCRQSAPHRVPFQRQNHLRNTNRWWAEAARHIRCPQ